MVFDRSNVNRKVSWYPFQTSRYVKKLVVIQKPLGHYPY